MKLSAKKVERVKTPGRYGDGNGLYLQVVSPTNKSWLLRFERDGRERWLGLGPLHTFSLAEARDRARSARQPLAGGIDPIDHRRAAKLARQRAEASLLSFADAAKAYFDQHEAKWKNPKHRAQFLSTLAQYANPLIGSMHVGDIDTPAVLKVLEQQVTAERGYPAGQFWSARPETANRVRGRIEAVLDWASVRGHRTGDNPARWQGHLAEVLPRRGQLAKVEHHPALDYGKLPSVMAQLASSDGVAARALEFTILTAARTGEVIGARWSEIDLDKAIWTVPAERMKGGTEHRVPLASPVLDMLRSLSREADNHFVFIGSRRGLGLSNMAMAAVLKRLKLTQITVHGFRSTFRDWAGETTSFPNHVVEMALAHTIGDKVEAAYRRGDLFAKRKLLMAAWAQFCQLGK